MIPKPEAQIVGNIGMFYVCYRLSLLGWNAMLKWTPNLGPAVKV